MVQSHRVPQSASDARLDNIRKGNHFQIASAFESSGHDHTSESVVLSAGYLISDYLRFCSDRTIMILSRNISLKSSFVYIYLVHC